MTMYVFKTPSLIWIGEGESLLEARENLACTIRREWSGPPADERVAELNAAFGQRVPNAVRFIRTFPLSDMGVY